ncbi:hypothetical protein [Peptostreptococcus faecalis]|uniref:hypothetical protein n=1 Tax=Peptostreptococcus faecalis TaxID=2045015 RepID=UPI000C7D622F|nr:hypothetical protein [Peptostreptococcus faecalis]
MKKNKIVGFYNLTAFDALVVLDDEDGNVGEKVTTAFYSGGKITNKYTSKVHYDGKGDSYVVRYKQKYYFSEIMKVGNI